jgi:hypothetical protein
MYTPVSQYESANMIICVYERESSVQSRVAVHTQMKIKNYSTILWLVEPMLGSDR